MARDVMKTALGVAEKSGKTIIGSVDEDGFPNLKAMLKPREHDGPGLLRAQVHREGREALRELPVLRLRGVKNNVAFSVRKS